MEGDSLHWLFEHGKLLWLWGIAGAVLLGVLAAWRGPRKELAEAARKARAELGDAIADPSALGASGVATVIGTLVLVDAPDSRKDVAWTARANRILPRLPLGGEQHARSEEALGIAMGREVVALDGPLEVAVGSREAPLATTAMLGGTFPASSLVAPDPSQRFTARILSSGDRILARGTLRREALPGDGAGYRETRTAAKLVPAGDGIVLASATTPRLFGRSGAPYVSRAFFGFFCSAALIVLGGELCFSMSQSTATVTTGLELSPSALAAATPFRRDAALSQLVEVHLALLNDVAPDRAKVARGVRAEILRGDCSGAELLWHRFGYLDEASALAKKCNLRRDGYELFADGAFAEASQAFSANAVAPTLSVCAAHMAAHRWGTSADCVRAFADAREPKTSSRSKERFQALGCIADALAARDGNARARDALRAAANERAMCRVLYADLVPADERRALFTDPQAAWLWRDAQAMEFSKGRVLKTYERLMEEVDGAHPATTYSFSLFPDAAVQGAESYESEHLSDVPIGLMHHLLVKGGIPREARAYRAVLAGNVALFLALLGEHEDAEKTARPLDDVPDTPMNPEYPRGFSRSDYGDVGTVLATLRDEPTRAHPWLGAAYAICRECGLYAAMDAAARQRAIARTLKQANREANAATLVRRFRDVVFDREITVPLHLLESFDSRESE